MKTGNLFVKSLEEEGVCCIFGVPGEENLDFLESLRESSIQFVATRYEKAAGFMAATFGRLTGNAGVCLSTLGPGATNLATAAAFAQLGAMPMVMITGQKPIAGGKQGHFQVIDVVDAMQPLTKLSRSIQSGDRVPSLVREAFRIAEEERPGAAHLELPEDIAREESEACVIKAGFKRRPLAEEKSINAAVQRIRKARRPLLLIGAAANRNRTCRNIRDFLSRFQIPFFTTQMGKGVADENNIFFMGNAALSSGDFPHLAIEHSDLIINVGHDVVEKPPFLMKPGGIEVIHINYRSANVDPVYFSQFEVVGDIADSIAAIGKGLGGESPDWDFSGFNTIRKDLKASWLDGAEDDRFPMHPNRMVTDLRKLMPDNGILALDNGMYKLWVARNYLAKEPNTVLLDNAFASMGAGLPSAISAKLVHPDRPVLAVCGDGGFMMNSQELETAARLKLDLVILIIQDKGYGMIKWKQKDMGFDSFGLDFNNPDFVRYAQSYGVEGHRVECAADFMPLVVQCFKEGGTHLIGLPIDYDYSLNKRLTAMADHYKDIN